MGKCSCPKGFFHFNLLKIRDYPQGREGWSGSLGLGGSPGTPFPVWEAAVVRTVFIECVSTLTTEAKSSFLPGEAHRLAFLPVPLPESEQIQLGLSLEHWNLVGIGWGSGLLEGHP